MAEEALVRRAFVLAGISGTAVNAGGENTAPTRRLMDSSGIRSIEQLRDCTYDDFKSIMISHNKAWADVRQVHVDVMQMKKLLEIAFYCKELYLQNTTFDPDDLDAATWVKLKARIEFHKANLSNDEPKYTKFPKSSSLYFEWYEIFTGELMAHYCPEALCTLNALNKDDNFDPDDSTNDFMIRDHLFNLAGPKYQQLSRKLYLVLVKVTTNTDALPHVENYSADQDGDSALNAIRAQYEQPAQKRARRDQLMEQMTNIVFRGDGTDEISEYTAKLTSRFNALERVGKIFTEDEKVNHYLLKFIKIPAGIAGSEVAAAKSNCKMLHVDNFDDACAYIAAQIGPVCPKNDSVARGARRPRNIAQAATMKIRGLDVPLTGRVPDDTWRSLSPDEQTRVKRARNPRGGGGRGRGRGGRGSFGRGRGRGFGRGGYNNNGRGGYGRGRGGYGRGGYGGRFNNNNQWNNGNYNNGPGNYQGNYNNGQNNGNNQRQIQEANAGRNPNAGQFHNNGNNGQMNQFPPNMQRLEAAQSGAPQQQQQNNGNRGGQAGNAFGRGAYRGPP